MKRLLIISSVLLSLIGTTLPVEAKPFEGFKDFAVEKSKRVFNWTMAPVRVTLRTAALPGDALMLWSHWAPNFWLNMAADALEFDVD